VDGDVEEIRIAALRRRVLRQRHGDEDVAEDAGWQHAGGEFRRRGWKYIPGSGAWNRADSVHRTLRGSQPFDGDGSRGHGVANGAALSQLEVTGAARLTEAPMAAAAVVAVAGRRGRGHRQVQQLLLLIAEATAALQLQLLALPVSPAAAA